VSLVLVTIELNTRKKEEEKQSKRKSSNEHKSLSLTSLYLIGVIFGLGRGFDLFDCVFVLNAIALLRCLKAENLDAMNGGWLGVFIAPTTKLAVWWRLLSHGAPDSPVRHRTLSGAPATSLDRSGSTVGASVFWATGQSGGAPNRSCRLSGAPSGSALTSARTVAH
jgi:hypothetical protein